MGMEPRFLKTEVLVIGSGAAGCRAAIEASEYGIMNIILTCKGAFGKTGNTNLAGVVYSAALPHTDRNDSPNAHFEDTVVEGRYLGNQKLIEILVRESPKTVYELERYGMKWSKYKDGRFYQLPTPGHTYDRGVHWGPPPEEKGAEVKAGFLGINIQTALCNEIMRHPGITILDDFMCSTLLVHKGQVVGVIGVNLKTGEFTVIRAKATILATGGAGGIYAMNDMCMSATGDGLALAYRAGAELMDMEMHQFFPTAYVYPEVVKGRAVSSSRMWVLGLKLYNKNNERFMERYYPEYQGVRKTPEHMPRDMLSLAIYREIMEGRGTEHGGVWYDATDIEGYQVSEAHKTLGITTPRFEVAPTCHFTMAGVKINGNAETTIGGLYACGEVCGGIHGANRLGGNALAECLVFGAIAGKNAAIRAWSMELPETNEDQIEAEDARLSELMKHDIGKEITPVMLKKRLQSLMLEKVGIIRAAPALAEAIRELEETRTEVLPKLAIAGVTPYDFNMVEALEVQNLLDVADMTAKSALMREESRGAHYRMDFPYTDNVRWLKNIVIKSENGKMILRTEAPVLTRMKP